MLKEKDLRAVVDQVLREHALVLGGLVARGHVSYEAAWQLIHGLRAGRLRALRRAGKLDSALADVTPHPAISEFLREVGRS
ncbi:MAG: hypothetical protein ABI960_07540 [Candidatus Eisenbacteria bacterium]